MTNKKENKNITVKLASNTKNKDISKINLSTNEKHLYNKVVGHNKEGKSINYDVATLLSTGKKGMESIERIAKALKDNKEPLNAYKMAVSRFYKDMPKESKQSLQGLGVNGVPFIGKLSNSGGNNEKKKAVNMNIDNVNTFMGKLLTENEDSYNQAVFDWVDNMAIIEQLALFDHLKNKGLKVA